MEYSYKPTTHGRAVMAACMAMEKPLKITRVAFGSGKVDEDANLADVHELLAFVSDGAVADRRHENDRFFLTVQYANSAHRDVKMFLLSEFIVYCQDPETGGETDLLYGTLGDYRQPVPAYHPAFPGSVFNFPLELIISDEINVAVSAPAGLVTYDELIEAFRRHNEDPSAHADLRQTVEDLRENLWQYLGGVVRAERIELTIPAAGWTEEAEGAYPFHVDVPHSKITEEAMPQLTVLPGSMGAAEDCGLCPAAETLPGVLRVWARAVPASDIAASLLLLLDVRSNGEITIPAVGWTEDADTAGEFPLHADIAVSNSREDLVPMLTVLPECLGDAALCGISPIARTMDGLLRVYAKFAPDRPVKARLALLGTSSGSGGTGGGYTLPAATAYALGGVKVRKGSGLTVDGGGNLAIDAAGSGDVAELFGSDAGSSVE